MTEKTSWDFRLPEDCRDFLKRIEIGPNGAKITFLQQADGRQVSIDDASDEQVMQVVREFARAKEHRHKFKPRVVRP